MIGGDGSGTFTIEPLTKNTDELYESYSKGREDAWEAARKIVALSDDDRIRYFGTGYVLEEYSPKEAIEKLRQYEKEVENFEIGDEVESALVRKEDAINAIAEHLGIPASTWRPIAEGWLKNVPVMVPSFSADIIRCVDCANRDTSMCGFRDIISGRQQTRDDDFCSYARRRPDGHSRL